MPIDRSERQLQDRLEEVSRLLETHRVLESLTHRQEGPKRDLLEGLQHRQNLAELAKKVRGLHPADLAFIVEALPPDQRQLVWDQVAPPLRGQALVEMSDAVRQPIVDAMAHTDLVAALRAWTQTTCDTWLTPCRPTSSPRSRPRSTPATVRCCTPRSAIPTTRSAR